MSRVLLFECSPRRPSDGAVVAQRYCFKALGPANFFGVQWEPVVIEPPVFSAGIGFDGRQFGAAPEPQNGELQFALNDRTRAAAGLIWKNAPVTIRMAVWPVSGSSNPSDGAFTTIWTGQADEIAAGPGAATVTLVDAGQVLRDPAAVTKFGSSGDSLLDSADAVKDRPAGSVVPQAWGQVLGIPGILVDRANGIYLFANSAATAVAGFYDGGAAFTMGVPRASLAALQANVPAAGAVDYCLDAAGKLLARPWDTPNYPFTADATFGNTRAADIASAIVASRSSLTFKAGAVAAFNTLQPAACGIYVDDDSSLAVLLDRIFSGLGAFWRLTSAGTIDIQRVGFAGSPALTVSTFRGRPSRQKLIVPTGRRSLGYARNWRPHSESEIAAILLASDLAYADGTPVEALKPAEAAADVTADNQIVVLVPAQVNYDADYLGNIIGSITAESIRVSRGGTSIKRQDFVSYAITPKGGITAATVDNTDGSETKGDITGISFPGTTGSIEVVVSVFDVAQPKQIIQFVKKVAPPPAGGGSGSKIAYDTALNSCSATTDTVLTDPMTVTLASGESLYGTGALDFEINGTTTATRSAQTKWQYKPTGGSWTDFVASTYKSSTVSAQSGFFSAGEWIDPVPGYIDTAQTVGGLSAGDYEIRLVGNLNASGRTASFFNAVTVEAKV